MKVLYKGKTIEVKDELIKAINQQQKVDDAKGWMENYDLITDIENFTRHEFLKVYNMIDNEVWKDSGEVEHYVLRQLELIRD